MIPLNISVFFVVIYFVFTLTFTSSIDIRVGGIFKVNSVSEKAFSLAILKHNQKPDRKFRLISNLAMLKQFESNVVMNKICQQASTDGVLAIFGGNFTYVIKEVNDISHILQMPIFTADYDVTGSNSPSERKRKNSRQNYLLYMYPPIIDTLIDYIIHFEWIAFSYICNTGQGLYHLQHIIQSIHSRRDYVELNIDVRFISDPRLATKDLRNLDSYLKSLKVKRILLNIDTRHNLELILHRIVLMGMNRPEYEYFILNANLKEIDLHEFRYSGVDLMGLTILNENSSLFSDFEISWKKWITDSNKDKLSNILEASLMMDAVEVFTRSINKIIDDDANKNILVDYLSKKQNVNCYTERSPNRRRLIGYTNRRYEVLNSTLGKLIIDNIIEEDIQQGLTGSLKFLDNGMRMNFSVEIMKMQINRNIIRIGKWVSDSTISMEKEFNNYLSKESIKNKTIRVVTIESKPFLQLKKQKNNEILEGNERFEGFCVDLLNFTAELLGFKYEIHLVKDNNYGAKIGEYPNGTSIWNGMIGELLNGTADIAVAPLTINLARAQVVHFSEPFLMFGLSVMIKTPGPKKAGIFSFLRPLSYPVWGCYIAACLVVSCGLYVIARLSPYEWSTTTNSGREGTGHYPYELTVTRDFTFFNCVWFSIAAFVQQVCQIFILILNKYDI